MLWAIGLIGTFYLFTLVLGFGAAALLNSDDYARVAESGGNLASPLLAEAVGGGAGSTGGAILLALIAAVAFATILAVVAGLTLTSSVSVAHDLYNSVMQEGQGDREAGAAGGADRRRRHRDGRDPAGHPGAEAQHRLPGGAGLRRRGVGEPAVDRLQHVLEAVQHPRRRRGASTAA